MKVTIEDYLLLSHRIDIIGKAEGDEQKTDSLCSRIETRKGRGHTSSKLHTREVMLIRRLWFEGWTDYQIWKEHRIPFPIIQKAKNEIERQATKEFENKEMHAVELARLKERLMFVVDCMDSIAMDPNVSHSDRIILESVKLEALAILRDAVIASISSSDPRSALEKIVGVVTVNYDGNVAAARIDDQPENADLNFLEVALSTPTMMAGADEEEMISVGLGIVEYVYH